MANMLFANNCNTTLNGGITAVATSMVVTSATGFPVPTGSQYFYCTLADAATQTTIEIVKVTAVSGTTFTIVRGQDGTTGTIFASGAVVSLRLVRASLNDFPKLDETNTFTADQAITGQLTTSAGLATTNSFTATAPADGLVMDYATGFGRFSAFAGDGFQWYNAGVANTKLMQLSSTGVITTATWNGATVGVGYGGTGLTTLTANYIPYGNGASAFSSSSNLQFNGTALGIGVAPSSWQLSAIQIVNGSIYGAGSTETGWYSNSYYNSGWKYISTGYATGYIQNTNHQWFVAASGSANGAISFTQAMTLFNSGGLSLGNTTDPGATNLSVTGTILSGTTSTSGSMSNTKIIVGGNFRTYTSSGTLAAAPTANTIATVTAAGLYIVHCYIPGYNAGFGNWSNYCIVSATGASTLAVVAQGTNVNVVFSVSGSNIQVVQQSSAISYTWSILQIA